MAKILGVTRKTILNYEKMGLLTPAVKDEDSGFRYYTADNMTQIRSIRSLQALGLSLKEVAEYYYDTKNMDLHLQRLLELRATLDRNIQMLQVRSTKQGIESVCTGAQYSNHGADPLHLSGRPAQPRRKQCGLHHADCCTGQRSARILTTIELLSLLLYCIEDSTTKEDLSPMPTKGSAEFKMKVRFSSNLSKIGLHLVDLKGFEPSTSRMRTERSPN